MHANIGARAHTHTYTYTLSGVALNYRGKKGKA